MTGLGSWKIFDLCQWNESGRTWVAGHTTSRRPVVEILWSQFYEILHCTFTTDSPYMYPTNKETDCIYNPPTQNAPKLFKCLSYPYEALLHLESQSDFLRKKLWYSSTSVERFWKLNIVQKRQFVCQWWKTRCLCGQLVRIPWYHLH